MKHHVNFIVIPVTFSEKKIEGVTFVLALVCSEFILTVKSWFRNNMARGL
jgi:hypothetical protein